MGGLKKFLTAVSHTIVLSISRGSEVIKSEVESDLRQAEIANTTPFESAVREYHQL